VLAVVVALAATWGGVRLYFAVQTSNQVGAKMAAITQAMAEAEAQQRLLAGIQATTFGLFDRGKDDLAEDAWSKVQIVRDRVGAALALADRETEATLALDPTSARVRSRFAEVLFNRALLAESGRQLVQRDELLARMDLYDLDRSRRARWNQPGRVELTSDPPGAAVTLQRYDEDRFGRMSLQTVEAPPATPWEDLVIPPGSYLAVLSTPGRATTRAPFLLARGEFVQLKIPLLPETDVPPGFVPVPAGRFLVGSAEDDAQRRGFLHAVPLHQVWTGPFLVARYETTFADWVAWLRFLAPAQRQQRLPAVHTGGFAGALVFRELAGLEWELVIKPSSLTWKVRSGEPLDYPGRDRRAIQDWMRFPVTGISAADATAYAAWLASSGQVPGARLCTEWEWERAARGADGRNWPHGNDLAPDDANFDETYGKKPEAMGPDEVGSHPASRSPFGIDDAAGNAWEWTVSAIDPTAIAARGGSFYFDRNSAMAAEREIPEPSFRDVSVGFRVCADPVPIGSLRSSP
jgi:formylglycine-generating enzyme required for sulfatase activity